MKELKLIDKSTLTAQAEERIKKGIIVPASEMCDVVSGVLNGKSGKIADESLFNAVVAAKTMGHKSVFAGKKAQEYGSGFDIPRFCVAKNKEMSVREMINSGVFKDAQMSSNTLIPDWQSLWDALRIDISIRKAALDTIRQNIYNIIDMPASDKIFKATEFYPYGTVFEENNGEGQSVSQGESRAGAYESIEHFIYAAGFTWTLLAELFDKSIDPQKITDSVMIGYNAKRDDLSIAPILNYSYSGSQQTAASAIGTLRQELLYNTLVDAIDDISKRTDPITGRKIPANDLVLLASSYDGRHIVDVASGLPSTNERKYPALSGISSVVAYDGEVIEKRASTTTYTGVTDGKAYLIKKNRYMNVGIKRNLQLETDMRPDVTTLAREQRSWYFVEGQQTTGIASFIQEITLPTW